jgi:hypothetical protein
VAASTERRQRVDALKRIISPSLVKRAISKVRPHARPCPVVSDELTVWLVIGLSLFCGDALRQVFRWLMPAGNGSPTPVRNTLCMARQRLGPRILVELTKAVLRPLADADTPGAAYHGMPLRAVDCCNLSCFDSPANRAAFSPPRKPKRKRRGGRRAPPAFPQAKLCCVCEVGTHAMLHWTLKPMHWADCQMAPPLLKRLEENQLLLWDAGFYNAANLDLVKRRGAHLLGRLTWAIKPQVVRTLSDGSYLARLPIGRRRKENWGPLVRLIEYELHGMGSSKHKKHRLITTLLDEVEYPAAELAELYHSRWELELAIDELETHQLQQRVLVSQTPAGVVQEVAGLLMGHWLVRKLMFEASQQAGVAPVRISFTGTLNILRCRLGEAGDTPDQQRRWWRRVVKEIATEEVIEPRRPRTNPRVLKHVSHDFPRKRTCDRPQIPCKFSEAFCIIR